MVALLTFFCMYCKCNTTHLENGGVKLIKEKNEKVCILRTVYIGVVIVIDANYRSRVTTVDVTLQSIAVDCVLDIRQCRQPVARDHVCEHVGSNPLEAANFSLKKDCLGRVVLCCFVFLLCCVALPCLSKHLMDD